MVLSSSSHPWKVLPKRAPVQAHTVLPLWAPRVWPAAQGGPGAQEPTLPEASGQSLLHTQREERSGPASLPQASPPRPTLVPAPHRLQQGVGLVQLLFTQPGLHLQFAHDTLKTL